jgi:hypothetical protein
LGSPDRLWISIQGHRHLAVLIGIIWQEAEAPTPPRMAVTASWQGCSRLAPTTTQQRKNMTSTRSGAKGEQVPTDIRLVSSDTLVSLRRMGESIGLSGQWSSDQLAENLPRGPRFPIRVILINHAPPGVSFAPLAGSCYRCLVVTFGQNGTPSQFQIDLDPVDFEDLELMSAQDVLKLTRFLLDAVKIEAFEVS